MKYFNKHDAMYTAAGILAVVGYIIMFHVFSWLGWIGWGLNILAIVGLGAILGDFIQTWHIDKKFTWYIDKKVEAELDDLEQHFGEAWHLNRKPDDPSA